MPINRYFDLSTNCVTFACAVADWPQLFEAYVSILPTRYNYVNLRIKCQNGGMAEFAHRACVNKSIF